MGRPRKYGDWADWTRRSESGCLLWSGVLNGSGYGTCWSEDGRRHGVHREAYERAFGAIPEGLLVCHTCDVRNCVEPGHLFLGTQTDNMLDCGVKGRNATQRHPERRPRGPEHRARVQANTPKGEAVAHLAKLTVAKVLEIRRRLALGEMGSTLALEFEVSSASINAVKLRKTWKHV